MIITEVHLTVLKELDFSDLMENVVFCFCFLLLLFFFFFLFLFVCFVLVVFEGLLMICLLHYLFHLLTNFPQK